MSTDDNQRNPFFRPMFVGAAVLVALVVVIGVVIAIMNAARVDDSERVAAPAPSPSTTPTSEPMDVEGGASVCGLDGIEMSNSLSSTPEAEWAYQGTTAYPMSAEYGPAATSEEGARYCFQRSPAGALFMAANAAVQGSDSSVSEAWSKYGIADGPYYDELMDEEGGTTSGSDDAGSLESEGTRMSVAGFRILAYDGDVARVDLAVRGSYGGQFLTMSGVYELVWRDGDWKISTDVAEPLNTALIPDMTGYTPWGDGVSTR